MLSLFIMPRVVVFFSMKMEPVKDLGEEELLLFSERVLL